MSAVISRTVLFFVYLEILILLRHRSGRISHHQFGMQQQCADGDTVSQTVQRIVAAFADLGPLLADGSHRWVGVRADRQIVKTDDA